MSLSISGLNARGSLSGIIQQVRIHQQETPAGETKTAGTMDTVTTSARTNLSETETTALMSGLQDTLSAQRTNALSAHSGLDYTRAMKLLEGLD